MPGVFEVLRPLLLGPLLAGFVSFVPQTPSPQTPPTQILPPQAPPPPALPPQTPPPLTPSGAQLADGTPLPVRVLGYMDSESSQVGDTVAFIVVSDLFAGPDVVIRRGTRVEGVIVKAQRARWGFHHHDGRLEFRFTHTMATDGRVIRLRASEIPRLDDRVIVDRHRRHHQFQWASEADTFNAFVDGDYDF